MTSAIVGFEDIVGAASEYGPSEVAGSGGANPVVAQYGGSRRVLLARDLPKSMIGIPLRDPIAPGLTAELKLDCQREFRPDRLMLVSLDMSANDLAEWDLYRLLTFRVGDTNLNASPNPVPIACFLPEAVGSSIRAPRTTDPSLGIDLSLENANTPGEGAPEWLVGGGVWGPSARPGLGPTGGNVGAIVGAASDATSDPGQASNNDARDLPQSFVGIPYTTAPAVARQIVSIQCQIWREFRPDRLMFGAAPSWEPEWMVRDVRVGTTSLNCSINPIPSPCFAPLSFGGRLRATVTASTSVGLTIDAMSLVATGDSSGPICGAFFGPSRFPGS